MEKIVNSPVVFDKEGYLVNPDDWNEQLAIEFAKNEGISLQDDHWLVLNFIRDSYFKDGIVPDIRHSVKYLVKIKGGDKKSAKKYLFKLFPYGYAKQACKLAGMRRPRAWSTG